MHKEVGFDAGSRRQGPTEFHTASSPEVVRIEFRHSIRVLFRTVDDALAVGAELEAAEHAAAHRQGAIEFCVGATEAGRIELEDPNRVLF